MWQTLSVPISLPRVTKCYYVLVLIGLAIAGLVLLCINKRKVSFAPAELELPKESCFKIVYVNVGMILLVVGCTALIVASLIPL